MESFEAFAKSIKYARKRMKESNIQEFRNPLRNIRKLANCPRKNFASLVKLMNFAPCAKFRKPCENPHLLYIYQKKFQRTLMNSFSKKYTELCSALPSYFCFYFFSNQTTSEDVFLEDEWLGFSFLGLKEAR